MAVQIIVDSGSDLLPAEASLLGVRLVPLTVRFGDEEYADAVDLTHREFYEKLVESDTLPTTAQVPPEQFAELYRQVVAAGDTALVIALSSELSGTCQSAMIAAEEYGEQVVVVDSRNVTLGQRLLVLRAAALRDEGKSAPQIAAVLNEEKKRIRLLALLDTLEYLKKGGRISPTVAFAGNLLSIKPVVAVEQGKVALVGKARGSKNGNNLLRQLVQQCGGIDYTMPICLAYSGLSDAYLKKYMEDSAELWQGKVEQLHIATVGCVIGAHVGPGAVAVAFFEKE